MRFGLFIPQGWRLDLVGIDPPSDQWRAMSDLATYVDQDGAWDSLWVYEHYYTLRNHDHKFSPRHRRRSRVHLQRRQRISDHAAHQRHCLRRVSRLDRSRHVRGSRRVRDQEVTVGAARPQGLADRTG